MGPVIGPWRQVAPTSSQTMQSDLPGAVRNPRPTCWMKTRRDSVGRSRMTQPTRGSSNPSDSTSQLQRTRRDPSRNSVKSRARCASLVFASMCAALTFASRNKLARAFDDAVDAQKATVRSLRPKALQLSTAPRSRDASDAAAGAPPPSRARGLVGPKTRGRTRSLSCMRRETEGPQATAGKTFFSDS